MAKLVNYFKVVNPTPDTAKIIDNQDISGSGSYGNYTWFQRLVTGSASRLTRYREYDLMDNDTDVNRAIDIVAEEMTGNNAKTAMPLEIEYIDTSDDQTVDNNTVLTIRAALRYWCHFHDWNNRLFRVARMTIKYGDCFFQSHGPDARWEFIHPRHVTGAVVDVENVQNVIAWQVQLQTKAVRPQYSTSYNTSALPSEESDPIPSDDMIRFSLNDDMSDSAPFGESILQPVYTAFKQKQLLEDSVIIFRITRAPVRRVFYIDVGNMPPQRAKQTLEIFKNEIKQKKIPNLTGGQNEVDSVYNPQALNEDFFIAVKGSQRGSKIETLPAGQSLGEISDLDYFMDKVWRGLRIPLSYIKSDASGGGAFNDGRVGVAYISELRFALFVQRLQGHLERVLDYQFKKYLRQCGIEIDDSSFTVHMPAPENFGLYRQQELDSSLLGTFSTADGIPYFSKRWVMSRYLNLSDEDIAENERMKKEEIGIDPDSIDPADLIKLYGPESDDNDMMGGDFGGGFGPDAGGGGNFNFDGGGGDANLDSGNFDGGATTSGTSAGGAPDLNIPPIGTDEV